MVLGAARAVEYPQFGSEGVAWIGVRIKSDFVLAGMYLSLS
jgi:hypothetical protein